MEKEANVLNWFEIPVTDFARAKKFYETVFNIQMSEHQMGPYKMGFFPYEMGSGKLSGAIIQGEGYQPCGKGTLIYFNGNPDLSDPLSRVEKAGGTILLPKTQITPEIGYQAYILDTEGNKVAIHSRK
ncbi:MAG: VOC family protein [Bacteroidota bacterium]